MFIESQLTESLTRMNLDTIDIFMINCPERMIYAQNRAVNMDHVYNILQSTFESLETEVKRGRIGGYGICSNSIGIPSARDYLSLQHILNHSPSSNFLSVEFPFNLFERDASIEGYDGSPSLLDQIQVLNQDIFLFIIGLVLSAFPHHATTLVFNLQWANTTSFYWSRYQCSASS